uniref:Zinc finger PMZ-type domain-containing protein n=1 Tax=Lactuca sativa TaxID=4236 RepID=A0A9R1XB61_LACSA|nr:hypothetical protein LSAT_V11C500254240 [Lactuca sativa]
MFKVPLKKLGIPELPKLDPLPEFNLGRKSRKHPNNQKITLRKRKELSMFCLQKGKGAFDVDEELGDCDTDEHTTFPQLKVPFDAFLYDFCNVHVYNRRGNVDDEINREEGHSDNEIKDDEDEVNQDPTKFSVHDPSVHWKKMKPHLGEKYANQIVLRFCLTTYAVHNGYLIKVTKSSSTRLQVKCGLDNKGKRCTFKLWASWMNKEKLFQIKGLTNKHTCSIMLVYGNMDERSSDQTLVVQQRLEFISKKMVAAIKDGWIGGYRRFIGLDGWEQPGIPNTCVVINVKIEDNWEWFIKLLVGDLGLEFGEGIKIIYDQRKAVKEKFPLVEHRQCARHVYVNFKKVYNGIYYNRHFWAASMSTTKSYFPETVEELKEMNVIAYEHLMARNPESWSRAFYKEGRACDAVENGISKSFNSVILEEKTKPLLTMLEELIMYGGDVCPTMLTDPDDWCKDMRLWSVVAGDTHVFEVRLGFEYFQVDLGEQLFTCRLWEIYGIPCVHACATMNQTQQPETLIKTYKGNMRPLNGSKMWAKTPYTKPMPPPTRRIPERSKTRRRKHVTEKEGEYKKIKFVGGTNICHNSWGKGITKYLQESK